MSESVAQLATPDDPVALEPVYRRNFVFFLLDGILFSVAMSIMSNSTVIPDFIRRLTDSEVLISLSSNLFEIGWLIPQLFMARYLMRVARKKWWFLGPNIPVRFAMLVFAVLIVVLGAGQPGAILIAFLVCYGIAAVGDGVVGVPWVDLTASSLDDRWRARMFGLTIALSGLIMLGVSPLVGVALSDSGPEFPNNYALIFGAAGVLFVLSIPTMLPVRELPGGGQTVTTIPSLRQYIPDLGRVLRQDGPFRAMLVTRMLSSLFTMAGPFYIGFATIELGLTSEDAVPAMLLMQTIGTLAGALIYAWMGARRNLLYIKLALLTAAVLPISALLAGVIGPAPLYVGYFAAGLALSNLFMSYLNWVIQHATPEQRPTYTGLFNTVAALTVLVSPVVGGVLAQVSGYRAVFVVALVMVLGAFYVVVRYLPVQTQSARPEVAPVPAAD
ncbi:MAG: MFS transporter [Anaerolineae bacterium]|nr:MFS transporter [Anaerolineae bacterium]